MAKAKAHFEPGPAMDRLRELSRTKSAIGVIGAKASASHGDKYTNVDVAAVHEFGTKATGGNIPERSFLRATLRGDWDEIYRFASDRARLAATGKTSPREAFDAIGLFVEGKVRKRIRAGIPPELKSRDGIPLINTSQLISAISSETRRK